MPRRNKYEPRIIRKPTSLTVKHRRDAGIKTFLTPTNAKRYIGKQVYTKDSMESPPKVLMLGLLDAVSSKGISIKIWLGRSVKIYKAANNLFVEPFTHGELYIYR